MDYIIIAAILVGFFFYINYRKKNRLKREEEKRIQLEAERKKLEELEKLHNLQRKDLLPYLSQISEFDSLFNSFKSQQKYLSNYEIFNHCCPIKI